MQVRKPNMINTTQLTKLIIVGHVRPINSTNDSKKEAFPPQMDLVLVIVKTFTVDIGAKLARQVLHVNIYNEIYNQFFKINIFKYLQVIDCLFSSPSSRSKFMFRLWTLSSILNYALILNWFIVYIKGDLWVSKIIQRKYYSKYLLR